MVQKIIWSAEAEPNLREIKEHIEKDSPYYAERLVYQIYERVSVLFKHPDIGKVVFTVNEIPLRRLLHKSYRIVYFMRDDSIFVVAVYHQARQLPNTFEIDNLFQ